MTEQQLPRKFTKIANALAFLALIAILVAIGVGTFWGLSLVSA